MINREIPGLTKSESLVYLALLNLKEAGATKISERCGLFRTLVYDILTKLVEKGLVSYIKKEGKRIYRASSPNRLLELLKEKEEETKKRIEELNQIFQKPAEEVLVNQFEGQEAMKVIVEDMIESATKGKAKEFYFVGATGNSWRFFGDYLTHATKKVKMLLLLKRIDFKVIWSGAMETKKIMNLLGSKKNHRILPEKFRSMVPFAVYENKVIINGGKEKPFVISIENKDTAESFKYYFNFMWENAKEFKKQKTLS